MRLTHTHSHFRLTITITSFCFAGLFMPVSAQGRVFWDEGGVPVKDRYCLTSLSQCPDGLSGAYVAWIDLRHAAGQFVYAQHLDSFGVRLWADSGVRTSTRSSWAFDLSSSTDGRGGTVVLWRESFGPQDMEFRAQRLSPAGIRLWSDTAVVVSGSDSLVDYGSPRICSRHGGVFLAWVKCATPDSSVLILQVVDSAGQRLLGAEGRSIADHVHGFWWGGLFPLEDSGALALWTSLDSNIWAQRVDRMGTPLWQPGGVPVCVEARGQTGACAVQVPDGIVVAWSDQRSGDWDVYAQKLDADGSAVWEEDGVPVCVAAGRQGGENCIWFESLHAVYHQNSRVAVGWYDQRPGWTGIRCQMIDGNGRRVWDTLGVAVGTIAERDTSFTDLHFGLEADTAGGSVLAWPVFRERLRYDITAQKADSLGRLQWGSGLPICEYSGHWLIPAIATSSDDAGGTIACWSDFRFGWPYWSIYAQRYGDAPAGAADLELARTAWAIGAYPNPSWRGSVVRLPLGGVRADALTISDVSGRVIRRLRVPPSGTDGTGRVLRWDGRDETGRLVAGGVYLVEACPDRSPRREKLVVLP